MLESASGGEVAAPLLARALTSATMHEASQRRAPLPPHLRPRSSATYSACPALPVRCHAGDNLWIDHALAQASHDDVLIVDISAIVVGNGGLEAGDSDGLVCFPAGQAAVIMNASERPKLTKAAIAKASSRWRIHP